MSKYLFWDFDGTLGGRIDGLQGRAWSAALLEAIHEVYSTSELLIEDISPLITTGFPWHEPEKAHTHLHTGELWWAHMRAVFERIYMRLGFSTEESGRLASIVQRKYVALDRWELYNDTLEVLKVLQQRGWHHFIVSNHAPELRKIVDHLGLTPFIQHIINSAEVGYEKPNPLIYRAALGHTKDAQDIWMIGDNIKADVLGAESMGIKAILVREKDPRAQFQFDDLFGVRGFLK